MRDRFNLSDDMDMTFQVSESVERRKPQKPKTKDELKEQMLAQSIAKRKEWSKEFNLAEKTIYDLFSEFSCMKMIAKAEKN